MMKLSVLALVLLFPLAGADTPAKEAGMIAGGIVEGFVGADDIKTCIQGMAIPMGDIEKAVKDFEKKKAKHVMKGLQELADALHAVPDALATCKATESDVKQIARALAQFHSPKSFVFHIGKNIIVNHHEIYSEITTAVSDYKVQKWSDFGVQVGMALHKLIVGADDITVKDDGTPPPNKLMLFENFMKDYEKSYATEFEKGRRFQIFSENVDFIYATNAENKTYKLGITKHADQTFHEWKSDYLTGFKPLLTVTKNKTRFSAPAGFAEPTSVDWVAKGGVTSVKNQGMCGSCWAFSAVGALEGAMFVAGRPLRDLSVQHIIACDKVDHGCHGGLMDNAFEFVEKNGVTSLEDEPYLCQTQFSSACRHMKCSNKANFVLGPGDVVDYTDIDDSQGALEAAVAQQPVSVAIEADKPVFQHYKSGVLTDDACGSNLDHGVLVVGYGIENGQKYWKVKNSWGASFGEEGYIRLARGKPNGGECGIRKNPSFPTVKKADILEIVV